MPSIPLDFPAGYAPGVAVGYSDATGAVVPVSAAKPLPVSLDGGTATPPAPLAGSTSAATMLAGPFAAATGTPIYVTLAGTWTGTVRLLRSVDGGATTRPLTIAGIAWATFAANACEEVWTEHEAGVTFYLDIAIASGTLAYRVAQ